MTEVTRKTAIWYYFGDFLWKKLIFVIFVISAASELTSDNLGGMIGCHDDPSYEPEEGPIADIQFTWLGSLQYIHIKNGTPHYFRTPRVVLVSRLFVLSTANDASNIPPGYALGNVVFGDYERDEEECDMTMEQITRGAECNPAVLLIPIADVLLHPEYKHFGIKKSVALLKLLKPVRSRYVLPVCLPLQDFREATKSSGNTILPETFYYVDFVNTVPRDFEQEDKEVSMIRMLPTEMCYVLQDSNSAADPFNVYHRENNSDPVREVCTNGCGFRSGAPTIVHEHTGHWTLVALSEGSDPCPDPLKTRRTSPPPVHILIHPYSHWITGAITGLSRTYTESNDPFGYNSLRTSVYDERVKKGYIGKWWMGGFRCYDRGEAAADMYRFYHEIFLIHPNPDWNNKIHYYIELEAPVDVKVGCVKIGIPHRIANNTAWGIDSPSVKIRILLRNYYMPYRIEVEAWGYSEDSGSE